MDHPLDPTLYERLGHDRIRCLVCNRGCLVTSQHPGVCGVRVVRQEGPTLTSYGRIVSVALDPIEKKPLHAFLPGTKTYSVATPGCSMRCPWCQNHWLLDPRLVDRAEYWSPQRVVDGARRSGAPSLSFTYSEPTVSLEYVRDCFRLAREVGLHTVLVTNGNLTAHSRSYLLPYLSASNVDVKTYDEDDYRQLGADLNQVLETVKLWLDEGVHVEITTLVVPHYNDDRERFRAFATRLKSFLGHDPVWHLSAFRPAHHYTHVGPTPLATLRALRDLALEAGFSRVPLGNVGVIA